MNVHGRPSLRADQKGQQRRLLLLLKIESSVERHFESKHVSLLNQMTVIYHVVGMDGVL